LRLSGRANSIESMSTTRPAAVSSTTRCRRSTIGSGEGAPRGAASIAWAASATFWPTMTPRAAATTLTWLTTPSV
jgi:hypothetical protein